MALFGVCLIVLLFNKRGSRKYTHTHAHYKLYQWFYGTRKRSACLVGESNIPRSSICWLFFIPANNFHSVYVRDCSWHVIRSLEQTEASTGESDLPWLSSEFPVHSLLLCWLSGSHCLDPFSSLLARADRQRVCPQKQRGDPLCVWGVLLMCWQSAT